MIDPASDLALARAVDDLRRGEIVRILGEASLDVLAAELATVETLGRLEAGQRADLLLTPERAATLNIMNQRAAAGASAVAITRAPWLDLVASLATADPADDLATPFKGPFPTRELGRQMLAASAAIQLAKRAGILPSVFAVSASGDLQDHAVADAEAILKWSRAPRLRIISRARLPLDGAENTEVIAFRPTDGGPEHLALVIGDPGPVPLVRLHSACLTGDVLGSLKCDCGPQLQAAVRKLAETGGILLYLQQEGRGIGLINKLRAYQLQDQGFDTVDANLRLGFHEDERDFDLGSAMLKTLGVERISLLSNNPAKAEALTTQGVVVDAIVPHSFGENPHNIKYLETKRDRQGHRL